jgi:hypothetical protein
MDFIRKVRAKVSAPTGKIIGILVITPIEVCLERNAQRERKVPEFVIDRMYRNFNIPQLYEGFDDINIINNGVPEKEFVTFQQDLKQISQDNPYHSLTIGDHCEAAGKYFLEKICPLYTCNPRILFYAASLHDIGKAYCKTFTNMNGKTTEIAHYYNHENVGAYLSLVYMAGTLHNDDKLEVANLIQWHMLLYKDMKQSTIEKYKQLLGENTWHKLELLYEADTNAK